MCKMATIIFGFVAALASLLSGCTECARSEGCTECARIEQSDAEMLEILKRGESTKMDRCTSDLNKRFAKACRQDQEGTIPDPCTGADACGDKKGRDWEE